MRILKCPHCGSKDCKEREITLDRIAGIAFDFGVQAVKSIFTGKMDYQRALNNSSQRAYSSNTSKRTYHCKTCGYTWTSGH